MPRKKTASKKGKKTDLSRLSCKVPVARKEKFRRLAAQKKMSMRRLLAQLVEKVAA